MQGARDQSTRGRKLRPFRSILLLVAVLWVTCASIACGGERTSTVGAGGAVGTTVATSGMAGRAGAAADAGAGGDAQDPLSDGDRFVDAVSVQVHPAVNTVLEVQWQQVQPADEVWLQFSFEEGSTLTSRPVAGSLGAQRDVVLGVPGEHEVRLHIVSRVGGALFRSREYRARTLGVPAGMPQPEVLLYDADLASSERWLFGAVEDSFGGSGGNYYYQTFWLYIMDRSGRIVWYYANLYALNGGPP